MATGDNLLTAQSVAKSCNILPDLNLTYLGDISTNPESGKNTIVWQKLENGVLSTLQESEKMEKYLPWIN